MPYTGFGPNRDDVVLLDLSGDLRPVRTPTGMGEEEER